MELVFKRRAYIVYPIFKFSYFRIGPFKNFIDPQKINYDYMAKYEFSYNKVLIGYSIQRAVSYTLSFIFGQDGTSGNLS